MCSKSSDYFKRIDEISIIIRCESNKWAGKIASSESLKWKYIKNNIAKLRNELCIDRVELKYIENPIIDNILVIWLFAKFTLSIKV